VEGKQPNQINQYMNSNTVSFSQVFNHIEKTSNKILINLQKSVGLLDYTIQRILLMSKNRIAEQNKVSFNDKEDVKEDLNKKLSFHSNYEKMDESNVISSIKPYEQNIKISEYMNISNTNRIP